MRLLKRALVVVSILVTGAAPAGLGGCGENGPSCLAEETACGFLVSDKNCCDGLQCVDSKCFR